MITCTLRGKKYSIDFVSGRALRELEPAALMYAKVVRLSELAAKGQPISDDAKFTISEAMDTMIRWFCILFQNQFTPDDVLDNYPVDRLMHDIALALMAVQARPRTCCPISLRRRRRNRYRSRNPDAAGLHLFHLQRPHGVRLEIR